MLLGESLKQWENSKPLPNNNRDNLICSEVTKIAKHKTVQRKRLETHVAIIYPTENKKGEDTDDLIKNFIIPAHLKVGIKRLKNAIKSGILMEVNIKDESEIIDN